MCLPQDPLHKAVTKIDPLAKVDGRAKLSEKYGSVMDPLGSAASRQLGFSGRSRHATPEAPKTPSTFTNTGGTVL